jgi:hypothetical protein
VTGSTFSSNSPAAGAAGLSLVGDSTATMNATVSGNTFQANRGEGFLLSTGGGAGTTATMRLTFRSNDVLGGHPAPAAGQPGVFLTPGGGAQTWADVSGNRISGNQGNALLLSPTPDSTGIFDATVEDNTIGNGAAGSGSAGSVGIWAAGAGSGQTRLALRRNNVGNTMQHAVYLAGAPATGAGGRADYTVTGNTLGAPTAAGAYALRLQAGDGALPGTAAVCADVGGSTSQLRNTFASLAYRVEPFSSLELPAFTTGDDVATYMASRNDGSPAVTAFGTGAPAGRVGGCSQPSLP